MSDPWIIDQHPTQSKILETLWEYGLAVVPGALDRKSHRLLYDELAPHFEECDFSRGLFYGARTKRFGRVICRSEQAQALALKEVAYGAAKAVLGPQCQTIQLNLTQAIEIWPGSYAQVPHRDQDIWLGALHPGELMINAMWALDDFTVQNGATLLWPGSHRTPQIELPDTAGVAAVMPAGSVCLFLGSTLHAGGANWSSDPRRGLIISYCLGWLKPCENPWLSYPPQVARTFAPELSTLVGYRQAPPSLNNVEGKCPSLLLESDVLNGPFADLLTPEQRCLIEQYNAGQLEPAAA